MRLLAFVSSFACMWWLLSGGWIRVLWWMPEPVHARLYALTGHLVVFHRDCCGRDGPWFSWQRLSAIEGPHAQVS